MSRLAVPDLAELRDLAVGVAREAGELLASRAGRVEVAATKSSPTDVVTEMDRRAEELIRARLLAARPDDAILGEEAGQTGTPTARPSAGWSTRSTAPSTTCTGCTTGRCRSPPRSARWRAAGDGRGGWRRGRQKDRGAAAVYVPMRGELFSAVRRRRRLA